MSHTPARKRTRLKLESLERRDTPAAWQFESFDTTPVGTLPPGWAQWSNATSVFAAASSQPLSSPNNLVGDAASNVTARTWQTAVVPADTAAAASVYANSLIPTEVMVRGQDLSGASPTFYAARVVRGVQVDLVKSVNGTRTTLATITSADWVSSQWLKVTLQPQGSQLQVEVYNVATGKYLNAARTWQTMQTYAIVTTDSAITADGVVGINRPAQYAGPVSVDDFGVNRPDAATSQNFDTTQAGTLPVGWSQFSLNDNRVQVLSGTSLSPSRALAISGLSPRRAVGFVSSEFGTDAQVTSAVYLNGTAPAEVVARGTGLGTRWPSYYGVSVRQGLQLRIARTVNGVDTVLYQGGMYRNMANVWVRLTLHVEGPLVKVRIQRADNGLYFSSANTWVSQPVWHRELVDSALSTGAYVGVARLGQLALDPNSVYFDDFSVTTPPTDTVAPTVTLVSPSGTSTLSGTVMATATAADDVGVARVEWWLDGQLKTTITQAPYNWSFNTTAVSDGSHTLLVKAFDAAGNVGSALQVVVVQNGPANPPPNPGGPAIPRHYQHIRVAQLAYYGTPFTTTEQSLLQNSVDLVVPNPAYLQQIDSVAPNTPQLIYTNLSNLYEGLLTDWLNYADAHSLNREAAFYHVAQATNYSGGSPSSIPVTYLWGVDKNGTDLTAASRGGSTGDVPLGGVAGDAVRFGYTDKFRELNFAITSPASAGWVGSFEYVKAVNAAGQPTQWGTLALTSDSTNNFGQTGRVTFDPPADWKPSVGTGSVRYYYVRLRTLVGGTAPIAASVLGRDYVGANGGQAGIMPAFDASVDANGDGYLNDAEYAARAGGKDARFEYESRLFFPYYGQMRFATNPSSVGARNWAADFHVRMAAQTPFADGFFVDNSDGKSPRNGAVLVESDATFAADMGQMLNAVSAAIAPRWLIANTSGGNGSNVNQIVSNVAATMEEFALRPMTATWSRFLDQAGMVQSRLGTANSPYLILDTHPEGGSPTDPRTQTGALAYYYLLSDPVRTFVMFNGGYEPATSWSRHWVPSAAYDIGQPAGAYYEFAAGNDPANANLLYKVYGRNFTNALVLYKPLSYKVATGTGTLADGTATSHNLGGNYRLLAADGTLGPVITTITLRNGEGAVLVKA